MARPKFRIWWIPQVPGKPFHRNVKDPKQALFLLEALAEYDKFQLDNNIKPDYCNMGGLEVFADDEWTEWYDEDEGYDVWGNP